MQQSLAQEEDGAISQGTNIMQQNTRLIILTLEASHLVLFALRPGHLRLAISKPIIASYAAKQH